jgi:hypothetical protein
MLEALRQIVALPDALGAHACEECAHPEMRLLTDGTFHCPACRSEVFPVGAPWSPLRPDEHSEAYWAGWVDGRFGKKGSFADNQNLAKWKTHPTDSPTTRATVQAAKPAVPVTGETRTPTKSSSEEEHDEPCERFVRHEAGKGRGPLLGGEVMCIPSFPGSWSSGRDLLFAWPT